MQLEFYTLPLVVEGVMNQKEHLKCSLQQSVMQHLHLILTTSYGEFPGDESFGCSIWDLDFDNVTSIHKLKEIIRQSILQAVLHHEKRLGNIRVEVQVRQEELLTDSTNRRVKKRMDVMISGVLQLTNEKFNYKDSFFIGPLSY